MNRATPIEEIASTIECSTATVYNELKRCKKGCYSAEIAQNNYDTQHANVGNIAKLENDKDLCNYISHCILDLKYSPATILHLLKTNNKYDTEIKSVNTIYKAIKDGLIEGVTEEDLARHGQNIRRDKKTLLQGMKTTEQRPIGASTKEEFGHWNMVVIEGNTSKAKAILLLYELKTGCILLEELKHPFNDDVIMALNRLEKRFGADFFRVFKSITVGMRPVFYDYQNMEQAKRRAGKRTQIYFFLDQDKREVAALGRMVAQVRKYFPDNAAFDKCITKRTLMQAESLINQRPSKKHDWKSPESLYIEEAVAIGCAHTNSHFQ